MKSFRVMLGVIVLGGLVGMAAYIKSQPKVYASEAVTEQSTQTAELKVCKERLAMFHKAWKAYKDDHKGGEPPNIEALFPKYVKDGKLLICPTAERWLGNKKAMQSGQVTIDRKQFNATYGFMWLTSQNARNVKHDGEKAPLMVCSSHEEALYRAGYHKPLPLGVFSSENRPKLIAEVAVARSIQVSRDGNVTDIDPATEVN